MAYKDSPRPEKETRNSIGIYAFPLLGIVAMFLARGLPIFVKIAVIVICAGFLVYAVVSGRKVTTPKPTNTVKTPDAPHVPEVLPDGSIRPSTIAPPAPLIPAAQEPPMAASSDSTSESEKGRVEPEDSGTLPIPTATDGYAPPPANAAELYRP